MGAFANEMRQVALDLMKELGSSCTLERVTAGAYNPRTGKTDETVIRHNTWSAPMKKVNVVFSDTGAGTNLTAFDNNRVTVPWIGEPIDATWTFNGQAISNVEAIESQNSIIVYNITVGEK